MRAPASRMRVDHLLVPRAVEHDHHEVADRDAALLGDALQDVLDRIGEREQVRQVGAARELLHVDARAGVEHRAARRDRDHRERVGHALGGQRRALERIDGDVDLGAGAVADLLAVVEHRRFVLLALADHDDAVHVDGVEERAHAVHGGLVGRDLVAAPDLPRRRQRAALGGADDLEREVTVRDRRHRCQSILRCAPAAPIRGVPLPDIDTIRRSFSSLSRTGADGRPLVFLDGPGGAQVPDVVIDAMADYLRRSNANIDGAFVTSQETTALVDATRVAAADFLGCKPEEIDLRAQHDDDQLQPRALLLPHARARRRDRRHGARPRRERQPVAAVRGGSRPRRARRGRARRRPAGRARGARGGRRPAHEGVRLHARLERASARCRDAPRARRRRALRRRARLDGLRALRAAPPHRRRRRWAPTCCCARPTSSSARIRASASRARSCSRRGPPIACARPARRRPATASRRARRATRRSRASMAAIDFVASLGEGADRRAQLDAAFRDIVAYETGLTAKMLDGMAEVPGMTLYGITRSRARGRAHADLHVHAARHHAPPDLRAARRARHPRLGRQLLRPRHHGSPRPRGPRRRDPPRLPPLHDRGRGRSHPRGPRPRSPAAEPSARRRRAMLLRPADVAELVDAHGSGPCGRKVVEVQVLSSALLLVTISV